MSDSESALKRLLGTLFIGVVLSSILYGITWLQVYLYFTEHSSRDGVGLKSFVAMLLVLDSLHLSLLCHAFYMAGIANFGDVIADLHAPWSLVVQCMVGVTMTTCIQQFYAVKIYQLSKRANAIVPLFISLISANEIGFCIVFSVKSFEMGSFSENDPAIPYGVTTLSLEVACAVFITMGMVYYLLQQRSGGERSNPVINLLIKYIINSGALNLVFASTCLITYVTLPRTLIYAPSFFILVRLYVCSFITILNSRVNVRSRLSASGEMTHIGYDHSQEEKA